VLLVDVEVVLPAGDDVLLVDELLPILMPLIPPAAGALVVFPCANTGAAIPTINDTAATIDTIAIKFNLDMHR
jgi:hypothetical protein